MSPSRAVTHTRFPISPELRSRRALEYWHKHGKFIFTEPGYDPATCTVKKPYKPKPKPKVAGTSTPSPTCTTALTHMCTTPHTPKHTPPTTDGRVHTQKELRLVDKPANFYDGDSDSDSGSDSTTGKRPYWMGSLVTAMREERETLGITPKDYGKRWVSGYRYRIGPTPDCGPADHDKAQRYWYKILQALDDDDERWTPSERIRLKAMEAKWRKRKDGRDPRFEMLGNRRGGLDATQKRELHDRRILEDIARLARGYWREVRDK